MTLNLRHKENHVIKNQSVDEDSTPNQKEEYPFNDTS
jgi:hypothetical protein